LLSGIGDALGRAADVIGPLHESAAPYLILVVFAVFVGFMYTRVMPAMVALPCMALAMALVSGMDPRDIIDTTVRDGALRLHGAYTAVMFGAILSQLVQRSGIAEAIVKWAAELSGDRPLTVTCVLCAVTMVLFTALTGLGGVIMVASIVFPILIAVGVRPMAAGCVFLIAVAIGGLMNVANWQFYIDALHVRQATLVSYCELLMAVSVVGLAAYLWLNVGRGGTRRLWAERSVGTRPRLNPLAFLTPLVPLLLVVGFTWGGQLRGLENPFEFPPIAAMACGIAWGLATVGRRERGRVQLLAASATEGIRDAAPAVAIMIGIGMVVVTVGEPTVSGALQPLVARLDLRAPLAYVAVFGLCAPLALYRGPLNAYGLGTGIAVLLVSAGVAPAVGVAAALLAVGQVQGICDPTNTHNVWVADYLGLDVQDILKRTLPYAWLMAVGGLVIAAIRFL